MNSDEHPIHAMDATALDMVSRWVSDWPELTYEERHREVVKMRADLAKLRHEWTKEIEITLARVILEREGAYDGAADLTLRVEAQATAISLALMALDEWRRNNAPGFDGIAKAIVFLEGVLPATLDGLETPGGCGHLSGIDAEGRCKACGSQT